jgi:hypothetical protein
MGRLKEVRVEESDRDFRRNAVTTKITFVFERASFVT